MPQPVFNAAQQAAIKAIADAELAPLVTRITALEGRVAACEKCIETDEAMALIVKEQSDAMYIAFKQGGAGVTGGSPVGGGPTGPTAPTGPTSPTGPTGPTNPSGPTGPTSPTVTPPAQTIDSFTATPSTVTLGAFDTLAWSTSNATGGVTLDGVPVGPTGTRVEGLSVTTTHTLAALGPVAPVTRQLTVTVTAPPPPPIGGTLMPPATQLVNAEGAWTLEGVTSGHVLLNGVWASPANISPGEVLELLDGTIAIGSGASSYVRWLNAFVAWPSDPAIEFQAAVPTYIGPTNTPDIWSLEMTDMASIQTLAGYNINASGSAAGNAFAFNPQFLTDSYGIKYLRFTNNPNRLSASDDSGSTMIALFLPIQPGAPKAVQRESMNVRWLMWIEDDVAPAFNDVGMKLPGPTSESGFPPDPGTDLISGRTFHKLPVGNTFQASEYRYDRTQALTGTFPTNPDYGVSFKTNRWYTCEVRIVLNTFTGSTPNADGRWAYYLNGNKIYELTTHIFRANPLSKLSAFHFNFYHGGHNAPSAIMHYRVAKLAMSSSYIGVPSELFGNYPAWRTGKTKDTVYSIAGTANMAGNMAGPFGGTPVTGGIGKASADITSWSGFAADYDNSILYGVAEGGDKEQWSNKVFKVALNVALPQFNQVFAGTTENTAVVLTPGNNTYYTDGLPKARQAYYNNFYIPSLNGVIMAFEAAQFCNATVPGSATMNDVMDFFNTSTNTYSAASTYPTNDVPSGLTNGLVHACAKHPVTHEVYASDNAAMKKWSPVTGNWAAFRASTGGTFRGAVIDATRNRWVWCSAGVLVFLDLTTVAQTTLNVTGDANFTTDSSGDYLALIHDTDNDRYLLFCGDTAEALPGRIYQINPVSGVCSKIADVSAPVNGWCSKPHFFPHLGAVVWLANYSADLQFLPTR